MEVLSSLWLGFSVALQPTNLMFCFAGVFIGTLIGALIISVIANGFVILGVNGFWQYVATGIVIIVAVLLDQLKTRVTK